MSRNIWSKIKENESKNGKGQLFSRIVNADHMLEEGWVPKGLVRAQIPFAPETGENKKYMQKEAAAWAKRLFHGAADEGIKLYGVSGYRSYNRQKEIYEKSIRKKGLQHTQKYIARPGSSEHQTGLALDVTSQSVDYELEPEFGQMTEGIWLRENAPLYGFVIRYPKEKENITHVSYEPWHIRYVTQLFAFYLTKADLVLEEFE